MPATRPLLSVLQQKAGLLGAMPMPHKPDSNNWCRLFSTYLDADCHASIMLTDLTAHMPYQQTVMLGATHNCGRTIAGTNYLPHQIDLELSQPLSQYNSDSAHIHLLPGSCCQSHFHQSNVTALEGPLCTSHWSMTGSVRTSLARFSSITVTKTENCTT